MLHNSTIILKEIFRSIYCYNYPNFAISNLLLKTLFYTVVNLLTVVQKYTAVFTTLTANCNKFTRTLNYLPIVICNCFHPMIRIIVRNSVNISVHKIDSLFQ